MSKNHVEDRKKGRKRTGRNIATVVDGSVKNATKATTKDSPGSTRVSKWLEMC